MLKKCQRIAGGETFGKVFKSGRGVAGDYAVLFTSKIDGNSKFACVVSKKNAKTAVLRNKLRRRVYYIVRKNYKNIKPGFAAVLVLKQKAAGASFSDLEKDTTGILRAAGLLEKEI